MAVATKSTVPGFDEIAFMGRTAPALIPQWRQKRSCFVAPSWTRPAAEYEMHRYVNGRGTVTICSCEGFQRHGRCRHIRLLEWGLEHGKVEQIVEMRPEAYTNEAIERRVPGYLRSEGLS